jgi:flagellar hook-associated protein 2
MSTSTTSSSSVSSFYTRDGVTRLNGSEFASGLDTQSLITALTAKTTSKITHQQQLEQKAEWKRDMYREVEDLLQSFSDTYFSYATSSSKNIMSSSFFDSGSLISSDSSVVTATGSAQDAGNVAITQIKNLASAASYIGEQVSQKTVASTSPLGSTISSASYLNLSVNGTTYTVSLGANLDMTGKNAGDAASALAEQLQSVVDANSGLKDAVSFSADSSGIITMTGATITGGSQNLIDGLGMTAHTDGDATTYSLDGSAAVDIGSLTGLCSQLAGTSLTLKLDGLKKTITFNASELNALNGDGSRKYSDDAAGIASYLQDKLDSAFGSGRVTVDQDLAKNEQKLSFSTNDATSVLTFDSATSNGVLGTDGLLHIRAGETNRLELDKTLQELSDTGELGTALSSGSVTQDGKTVDGYKFTINGKEFSFGKDTELNTIINTINNDTTANVTVSYSQTLNEFRIVSDDTGSQGTIEFSDESGNLTAVLFGSGTLTAGQDLNMTVTIGGTSQTITRSTNQFTLDGITMTVNGTLNDDGTTSEGSISFSADSDVDDLYQKITDFVSEYNKIIDKVNTDVTTMPTTNSSSNGGGKSYEPLTDAQKKEMTDTEITEWNKKAKQGLLFSDPQLSALQSDLRSAMENAVASVGISLASIGISTKAYDTKSGGKLVIDETALKSALQSEPEKVKQLFTNSDGISQRVKLVINKNIGAYGNSGALYNVAGSNTMIGSDNSELGNEITDYKTRIKELQTQLKTEQDQLQTKFTRMETLISQLSDQYNYLMNMSS